MMRESQMQLEASESSVSSEREVIDKRIREAGYDPYPTTDAVSESLYRDQLTTWLNEQAGFAFVQSQEPKDDVVTITFELPFGGTFTQDFRRPDTASTSNHPEYEELLNTVGLTIDSLDELPTAEVSIVKTRDEWTVDLKTTLTVTEKIRIALHDMRPSRINDSYTGNLVRITVNRFVILPIFAVGLAYSTAFQNTLIGVLSLLLPVLVLVMAMMGKQIEPEFECQPRWVNE